MATDLQTDFVCSNNELPVTPAMKASYEENGYIIVRSLLSREELTKLKDVLETDGGIVDNAFLMNDGAGRQSRMSLWSHPGKDITGMVARSEKVAGTLEELMGGEIYHYHTKLAMKEAHTGGQFVWHQDYGYWYQNTCLFPDLASAFIAIDKADIGNGCLKILKGSHKAGRIDHVRVGGQNGADIERVEMLMKVLPLIEVELEAGDALFFHCNVLHRSEQNNSDRRRWAFIMSYNRASNNPVRPHHHPQYTPLVKVANSEILNCQCNDLSGKEFMDPKNDKSIDAQKESDVKKQ